MRISCTNRADGRFCMTLAPEKPTDPSPPTRDLLVDASIIGIPGDRLVAAAALAYGNHFRGVITSGKPVSPLMSRALSRFFEPSFIAPANISSEGTQFTGSGTTLVLDPSHRGYAGRNRIDRAQVISVEILPMTTWTGRLFSMDRLVTASNADLFAHGRSGAAVHGPSLAVALAFSHELHVSQIVLPVDTPTQDPWFDRATALLAATGVDLRITSMEELAALDLVEELTP